MKSKEQVNHPEHYSPGKFEVIKIIEFFRLGYRVGNVIKYLLRAHKKRKYLQDLRKARWYLDREIKKESKRRTSE